MLQCRRLLVLSRVRLSSVAHSQAGSSLPHSQAGNVSNPKSEEVEVDPLKEYTMFGNIRKTKKNPFHYTDRKSGTGYSDFSNTIYQHRPYIWPPLRKLFNVNFAIIAGGLLFLSIDFEWFMNQLKIISKGLKPEASQLSEASSEEGETSDSVQSSTFE
ncbi:hypothetical protein OESDEN_12900 [Oesophagostomum dentatum]|uniref:Uncharacterized protein n=1 Tax=Oesophagostomum dentatum TaxID=61180 RepID=A0A0B1SUV8_OESDE|nr:hypothetical protein OESDEN_12900 [Oesophagostomum dentatum]